MKSFLIFITIFLSLINGSNPANASDTCVDYFRWTTPQPYYEYGNPHMVIMISPLDALNPVQGHELNVWQVKNVTLGPDVQVEQMHFRGGNSNLYNLKFTQKLNSEELQTILAQKLIVLPDGTHIQLQ